MASNNDGAEESPAEEQTREVPGDGEEGKSDEGLKQQLEQKEQQYQDACQKWLRCQADFDNFRKRQQRRLEEEKKYGTQSLLCDLLEPLDNFDRALVALKAEKIDGEALRTGIGLVSTQLMTTLSDKWGLKRIEALGQPYDANAHQAVSFVEVDECSCETVLEEFQTGYLLHDRVIRPAMVKVGKPVKKTEEQGQKQEGGADHSAANRGLDERHLR